MNNKQNQKTNAKSNKRLYIILISAVVAVAAIVTLFLVLGGDGNTVEYKSGERLLVFEGKSQCSEPILDFLKATLDNNGDAYFKVFPPEAAADYTNESAPAVQVHMGHETMDGFLLYQTDRYEDFYGDNIVITVKVLSEESASFEDIEDWNLDQYTFKRYITRENTEEIKKITIDYTVKGDLDKDNRELAVYVVKQDGKWYMHPTYAFQSL